MQCPVGDGELLAHTTQGENNLTVSYSTCSMCHAHWMESFAANFITLPPEEAETAGISGQPQTAALHCPVCQKDLDRAAGDNIPETVRVYVCPDGHGNFFPSGQLAAFKAAQKAKIAYHKTWNLPLPGVKSVLLAGTVMVILAGGFIAAYVGLQNSQTTTSQATGLLTSQRAFVNSTVHDVLINVSTPYSALLTVHIESLNNLARELDSKDERTHTITLKNIPQGSYEYYFTIKIGNDEVQSPTYNFVMPE